MNCNYCRDNKLAVGPPYFVADVDAYESSESYFGTRNQGGNVWEWLESEFNKDLGHRSLRGGSWSYTEFGLNACNIDDGGICSKNYVFGARICMSAAEEGYCPIVPENMRNTHLHAGFTKRNSILFILFVICVIELLYICLNLIKKMFMPTLRRLLRHTFDGRKKAYNKRAYRRA